MEEILELHFWETGNPRNKTVQNVGDYTQEEIENLIYLEKVLMGRNEFKLKRRGEEK